MNVPMEMPVTAPLLRPVLSDNVPLVAVGAGDKVEFDDDVLIPDKVVLICDDFIVVTGNVVVINDVVGNVVMIVKLVAEYRVVGTDLSPTRTLLVVAGK